MHRQRFLPAMRLALVALCCAGANLAPAADCLPGTCAAVESADGGVPDGVFEKPVSEAAPSPAQPPAASVPVADEPGSAIFNPFSGGQERPQSERLSFAARLVAADFGVVLAIGLILTLALAAVAAFFFWRRKPA